MAGALGWSGNSRAPAGFLQLVECVCIGQLLDPRQVADFQSAILRFPLVKGRLGDAQLAVDRFYRRAAFLFVDGFEDTGLGQF